jgi:GT2 family glycosyltransferase
MLKNPMDKPLASIVICGYRRPEALRRAVASAQAQTYSPKEIIVVDCTPAESAAAQPFKGSFGDVRVAILEDRGACAARNHAVRMAKGEVVASLDDDAFFASEDELDHVVESFERHPEASCVVFKVLDLEGNAQLRDWCHPRDFWGFADAAFETCYIPEGACAFRREDFLKIGGYYEPYWIGDEGWDLTLRMLAAGLITFYDPAVRLHHAVANEGRVPGRIYRLKGRNCIWTAFKDYPWYRRYQYLAYKLALTGFLSFSAGAFRQFLTGAAEGARSFHGVDRTLIPEHGWRRLKKIREEKPGFAVRLRKLRQIRLHRVPQ